MKPTEFIDDSRFSKTEQFRIGDWVVDVDSNKLGMRFGIVTNSDDLVCWLNGVLSTSPVNEIENIRHATAQELALFNLKP